MNSRDLVAARLYREWVRSQQGQTAEIIRPRKTQSVSPEYKEMVQKRLQEAKLGQK